MEREMHGEVHATLQQVDRLSQETGSVLASISALHARIQEENRAGGAPDKLYQKLQKLYKGAISCSEKEHSVCTSTNQTLSRLIDQKRQAAEAVALPVVHPKTDTSEPPAKKHRSSILNSLDMNLPRWKGKGKPPTLCGSLPADPNYIVPSGHQVAARTSKPRDPEEVWILATVISFNADKNKYEVEDIMEEEAFGEDNAPPPANKHYVLPRKAVIPLPLWEPPPDHTPNLYHPAGTYILALYPQTTCFYPGTIVSSPNKRRNDYLIEFQDDEDMDGSIPQRRIVQRYVLANPGKPPASK